MQVAVVLLVAALSIYVAIVRPAWMWFAWLLGPILFVAMAQIDRTVNIAGTSIGPVAVRPFDGAILGMLIGIVYHVRREGWGDFVRKPGGRAILIFLAFVILKTMASVLLMQDAIFQSRTASHAAGGLVSAVGEVRDNLSFLFPALYVYAVRKSRDLDALGWPFFAMELLLIFEWVLGILRTGTGWTGTANGFERPTDATGAISLTEFGLILLFMRVPRVSTSVRRSVASFGIIVGTLANHRSQWMALAAGGAVMVTVMLLGRPMMRGFKLGRVMAAGFAFILSICIAALSYVSDLGTRFPIIEGLTVRLYAFTDPQRDADSKWRQALWTDRIAQVGSNWPWGRAFGGRLDTFYHGTWVSAPDHSAYVSLYELGGVILSAIMIVYFVQMILSALQRLVAERKPDRLWPAAVGLSLLAADLAFGGAYSFPLMSPALIVIFVLGERSVVPSTSPVLSNSYKQRLLQPIAMPKRSPVLG